MFPVATSSAALQPSTCDPVTYDEVATSACVYCASDSRTCNPTYPCATFQPYKMPGDTWLTMCTDARSL